MKATCEKLTKTYSQAAFDKWVAREVKSMYRLRAKGHRDFRDMTDVQIHEAAESLGRIYNVGEVWA